MGNQKLPRVTKRGGQRTVIDWSEARAWFMEDVTRSYSDVARQFKVSKRTVEFHAKLDGEGNAAEKTWAVIRRELGAAATAKHEAGLIDDKAQRAEVHLGYFRELQDLGMTKARDMKQGVPLLDKFGQPVLHKDGSPVIVLASAVEIQRITRAVQFAVNGERIIMGLPTSVAALTNKDGEDLEGGWAAMLAAAEQVTRDAAADAGAS